MGQAAANGGLKAHGKGTSPITAAIEFYAHWGDEGVDELDEVTGGEATDLHDDALVSQAAFDTTADGIVSWYGFAGLSTTDRDTMREAIRKGCTLLSPP